MKKLSLCLAALAAAGSAIAAPPFQPSLVNKGPNTPVSEAEAAPVRQALISQSWTWTNSAFPQGLNLCFWKNGAISPLAGGSIMGVWFVRGARTVELQLGPTQTATLQFDNDLRSFTGMPTNIKGKPFAPVGRGVRKQLPVQMPVSSSPGQASIEVILKEADTVTNAIFVPLDGAMPDPGAGVARLREDLLDEAALKPSVGLEAYKAGYKLCLAWQGALAERRDRHAGYASASLSGTDFNASRKQTLGPGDYVRYVAELQQGIEKLQRDAQQVARFDESMKKNWADRGIVLRQGIDSLVRQLRSLAEVKNTGQ